MTPPAAPRPTGPTGETDDRPLDDGVADPGQHDPVDRLYRALPDREAGPAAELDERIRLAARRAVGPRRIEPRPRRVAAAPWWRRLAIPVSIAATALISANLVLMVSEAPERASGPAALPAPAAVPPAPPAAVAREAAPPPAPRPAPAAADAARGTGAARQEGAAAKAGSSAEATSAAPPAERRAASSALGRERRMPSERFDPAWQAPTAEQRLAAIQAMLERGDRDGARAALKALRARFPQATIPEPLRPLIGAD